MLVAVVVGGLYLWGIVGSSGAQLAGLTVSTPAAICAGVALLVPFLFYLWVPSNYLFETAFLSFALLVVLAVLLILGTGEIHSPFLALWVVTSTFAAIFGLYGISAIVLLAAAYAVAVSSQHLFTTETAIVIIFTTAVPLIISYFIWHTDKAPSDEDDHAYKELASELSQVSGKSDVVIGAIADGVIAIDSKGVIELINPAAQSIIGWGKQDALRLDYKSVLKLIDAKGNALTSINDPVASVLHDNQPIRTDKFTLVTVSGKNLLVSLVISPVGQIGSGAIIVFRDITREKAEEREQAEFISTASHEMRTPVASIEGYLGLTLNPNTAQIDAKARDFITKAHESAQHLGRLFQDLLDVSKADDGRMQNNPKVIDIVEFVSDVVEGLRPKADSKGLRLTYKPKPDASATVERSELRVNPIFYADIDPDHFREVSDNLVENAIKYTLSGDVIVDVTGDNDHVTISIQDSGIGIPPEDVGHLFQKFYRVDTSQTREIGGTGLGLYLCRRLVETMNGRIWVESEYKKGSTFFVELPRLSSDEAQRRIEQAADATEPAITPIAAQAPVAVAAPAAAAPQPQPAALPEFVANPQPAPAPQPTVSQPNPYIQQPSVTPPQPTAPPRTLADIERDTSGYLATSRKVPISVPDRNQPQ